VQVRSDLNYRYAGLTLGLMLIHSTRGYCDESNLFRGFALPLLGVRVGLISRYYFSAQFLDNFPDGSAGNVSLIYHFNNPLNRVGFGWIYSARAAYRLDADVLIFKRLLLQTVTLYFPPQNRIGLRLGIGVAL
jgi:hypothetical protein